MTLGNNYEQYWHLLEQHQKRQLCSTVIAQVIILDPYPRHLEIYRAKTTSFFLPYFLHQRTKEPWVSVAQALQVLALGRWGIT